MRTNLMLHAGASKVDREQLDAVLTPDATKTWTPIPHNRLLNGVQETLNRAGLTTTSEAHGLTKDGNRYFGLLQVQNPTDKDFSLVVGLRNSHDKKFPAGLVIGAAVFVCDNLSFSGEVKLSRKHTRRINDDLPQLIERAVGKLGDLRRTQEQRFNAYKNTMVSDRQAHDIVVRALDAQVVPVTKVPDVLQQWRDPNHPEFIEGNAWSLFNAFTETLKGNLDALPKRTQALHGILDAECGIFNVSKN
jgi:hypothetical protein